LHGKRRMVKGSAYSKAHMNKIRPKASEWHGSPEGIAWHAKNSKAMWNKKVKEKFDCCYCGDVYECFPGAVKRGFCSAKCQSAVRRASGIDNEVRKCAICPGTFIANKYAKTKTCGKDCRIISRTLKLKAIIDAARNNTEEMK